MRKVGYAKKRSSRRTKRFIILGVILIVLALAVSCYIAMVHAPSAQTEVESLAVSSADEAYYYAKKLYYINGTNVVGKREDSQGEIFSFDADIGQGMKLAADGQNGIIFAYTEARGVALDMNGTALFTLPSSEYSIVNAKTGGGYIAVYCTLNDSEYIRVFSRNGVELFRTQITGTLADYMLTSSGELAAAALDTSGASVRTSVMCYNPSSQSNTANITVYEQLLEKTVVSGNMVYMLGSTYMYAYTKQGNLNADAIVYSLTCSDYTADANGVLFAYLSRDAEVSGVRLLFSGGDWSIIFTPAGVTKALIGTEDIYCFADNEIYIYKLATGQLARTIETDFIITDAEKKGEAAIITSDSGVYYLAMS